MGKIQLEYIRICITEFQLRLKYHENLHKNAQNTERFQIKNPKSKKEKLEKYIKDLKAVLLIETWFLEVRYSPEYVYCRRKVYDFYDRVVNN